MADGGCTAEACDSRNTKLLELRFRARLTEDGTRHELVRALGERPVEQRIYRNFDEARMSLRVRDL